MLHDQATNAVLAIGLGSLVAVLLFIPVAAAQYRIDGRLGPSDLATLLLGAVYALAIWTYTLLPLPRNDTFRCKGSQLRVLASFQLIRYHHQGGVAALLREPAFLQVLLNLLLFVPLGWLVRVIAHRGVVVATTLGFAVSLLVELTQRTGDWHLYSCAYRLFDVDDLIVNTVGALLGSVLSAHVVRRRRREVTLPTTITLGRRLVGFACDVLFIAMAGATAALTWRCFELYGRDRRSDQVDVGVQSLLQWGVPLLVEAALVLGSGRTVGELVVSLHTRARIARLVLGSRAIKLAVGVGPVFVLAPLPPRWAIPAVAAYGVLTVVAAALTADHRGLSHVVAHLELLVGDDSEGTPDAAKYGCMGVRVRTYGDPYEDDGGAAR